MRISYWSSDVCSSDLKLNGFLDPPANTLQHYDASDPSIEARYARAIAYMQLHEVDNALAIVDSLLEKSPDDPFFHELKGDILRDAGREIGIATCRERVCQ